MEAATIRHEYNYKIETELKPVALSTAEIKTTLTDLKNLTAGAVFTDRSGQATARAELRGDTVIITALCDSLQREIYRLETYLNETKTETLTTEETHQSPARFFSFLKTFLFGVLAGLFLFPLLKNTLKTWL